MKLFGFVQFTSEFLSKFNKMAEKRVTLDHKKVFQDPPPGVTASLVQDDILHWKAIISGPEGTPFSGGIFKLRMEFPADYPSSPPKVTFYSRMFHPNVYLNGRICLDILEDRNKWDPSYDAASILFGIQAMLGEPNPDSPANGEANELFQTDVEAYEKRVAEVVEQSILEDAEDDEEMNYNLAVKEEKDQIEDMLNAIAIEEALRDD